MSSAAKAFVETLAKKDRGRGVFEFEGRERFDWHYTPRRRRGIAIGDMNETQRATAHALLRTGLSEAGYEKAVQTMRLEAGLKEIETFGFNRDPENRAQAIIAERSFGDILSGPGRGDALSAQEGLPIGRMRGEPRNIVEWLIEVYLGNASVAVASAHRRRISEAGIDAVRFAWAGFLEKGRPHYYCLHGKHLLIEFDKTRNDANHIHSVLRDPSNDFGSDYLGAHYASAALTEHDHSPHRPL